MRSIRVRMLAFSILAVLAVPGALPAAAQSDDDSAQVVLDWNLNGPGGDRHGG